MAGPVGPFLPGVGQPAGIESAESSLQKDPKALHNQPYKVLRATVVFGVVQRFIPGAGGKAFGVALSGLEKDPSGNVRPTPATALNALPVPFGFTAPESVGLKPNFYLPPGSSAIIPPVADKIGFGFPEQRLEDKLREEQRQPERDRRAAELVAGLDVETLEAIERKNFQNPRVTRIRPLFGPGPTNEELVSAATSELRSRGLRGPGLVGLVAEQFAPIAGLVAAVNAAPAPGGATGATSPPGAGIIFTIGAGQPDVLGQAVAIGSTLPALVEVYTGAALALEAAAEGIRRELVSERADP